MNKRNICFSILITVFSLMAVITMFLPYFRIGTTEVKQAFDTTFDGIAQLDSAFEDGGSGDLLPSRSGVKLLKDVIDIPTDQTYNYISGLKRLVVSMLLVAWITAVAVIVIAWVLKKKAKYIAGMTLSAVSIAASLTLYISVPGIAKNALVEAIEKSLFNDTGVYARQLCKGNRPFIYWKVLQTIIAAFGTDRILASGWHDGCSVYCIFGRIDSGVCSGKSRIAVSGRRCTGCICNDIWNQRRVCGCRGSSGKWNCYWS